MGWFRKINKNGEDYKPIGNVITATSLSVTGPDLADGDVVRVMFTTDIAGSDTSTPLALTWNGGATPIPVKASKEGSLASIYAFEYATNLYRYISAYVTLELAYDGTNQQFVVIGNPVILSGSNYTIYADGRIGDEPIATIKPTFLTSAPYGWLMCDGTVYNKSDYEALWAVLPNQFKNTSNNTFKVDLSEATLKGTGLTSYSSNHFDNVGIILGGFVNDRVQNHNHYRYQDTRNGWSQPLNPSASDQYVGSSNSAVDNFIPTGYMASGRAGNTTEVKAIGVNFMIKAK